MYRGLNAILIVILVLAGSCWSAPECGPNPEQCREHRMHPDLPEPKGRTSRVIEGEDTNAYWQDQGKKFVQEKLASEQNKRQAKNVIMFLGDGMGVTTTSSARNVLGGEEKSLSFDGFPYSGFSKTYSVNKIVPDSACTATAYLCGVKAQQGTIGVNGQVPRSDCNTMMDENNHVDSIAKWAMDAGKWAGLVTTTRVTHASPAGVYAHTSERDWEGTSDMGDRCKSDTDYKDIAYQLSRGKVGSKLRVIMGGGRKHFTGRSDGLDLIEEFKSQSDKNAYVSNLDELNAVDMTKTDRLMGLFHDDHLKYRLENSFDSQQPTLEQMTRKAIEYMSQSENGYFLFIEGGRIDHAHHYNQARQALNETAEFSNAIAAAKELTSEEDTLIVVTADHSHVFTYAGYAYRGEDVFGMAPELGEDGLPYTILSYSNGPSYSHFYDTNEKLRKDPSTVVKEDRDSEYPSGVPMGNDSHGGDDVPVYAVGPWSHLFTGVYEQNTIPHMMAYASCVGEGLTMCST